MKDITLEIILDPSTHDLSYDLNKEAGRYRRGDIVHFWLAEEHATLDANGDYRLIAGAAGVKVFGYIHIRNVPNPRAARMRDVLMSSTGETKEVVKTHPLLPGEAPTETVPDMFRKRKWRIRRGVMTPTIRDRLLAEREITGTWQQMKPLIRRKIIIIRNDASQDDESNSLQDSDL